MFHKAKTVLALPDYKLQVHFADGSDKLYDMSKLFDQYPVYKAFIDAPKLFNQAKVDVGGFGIVWDENIDIDSEEIYQNGTSVISPFTGSLE